MPTWPAMKRNSAALTRVICEYCPSGLPSAFGIDDFDVGHGVTPLSDGRARLRTSHAPAQWPARRGMRYPSAGDKVRENSRWNSIPIDWAAVNWIYVAMLAVFVFIAHACSATLLSLGHRGYGAVLSALSVCRHLRVLELLSARAAAADPPGGAKARRRPLSTPAPAPPVKPADPVTDHYAAEKPGHRHHAAGALNRPHIAGLPSAAILMSSKSSEGHGRMVELHEESLSRRESGAGRHVSDGMLIAPAGFGLCGMPETLIRALRDSGVKNLTVRLQQCRRRRRRPRPAAGNPADQEDDRVLCGREQAVRPAVPRRRTGDRVQPAGHAGRAHCAPAAPASLPSSPSTGVGTDIAKGKEERDFRRRALHHGARRSSPICRWCMPGWATPKATSSTARPRAILTR